MDYILNPSIVVFSVCAVVERSDADCAICTVPDDTSRDESAMLDTSEPIV